MKNVIITGFSDEACPGFEEQLQFVTSLGVDHIEIRGVSGKNVADLSRKEALQVRALLDNYGVKISSIGSPIGKIQITDPFAPHLEQLRRVIETAKILGTRYIRMFSFYIPRGENPADYRDEVLHRLEQMVALAEKENVVLLHENEKGIYGDNAARCLDLMEALFSDHFQAVFDFANFIQVGQDTLEAYEKLHSYVRYIHIKDAVGQQVVPAGFGEGNVKLLLGRFFQNGYRGFLSLEPHLADFAGFGALEQNAAKKQQMTDGKFWWHVALAALKAVLYDLT